MQRTLDFATGSTKRVLEVDAVDGEIHVTGYEGNTVEVTVEKTIRAYSPEQVRLAKDRVKLDIADKRDIINIYVDQPGHERSSRTSSRSNWSDPGYEVTFDFDIRVPRATEVHLWTVTGGDIRVDDVRGDFEVNTVNGPIKLTKMSGSGEVRTVNGPVDVVFSDNPKNDCSFSSLNGVIDVTFPKNLSADMKFKTFRGEVFTDFEVSQLPTPVNTPQRRNGTFVYRNEFQGVRIGKGGPMMQFDSFNGEIRVRQAK